MITTEKSIAILDVERARNAIRDNWSDGERARRREVASERQEWLLGLVADSREEVPTS